VLYFVAAGSPWQPTDLRQAMLLGARLEPFAGDCEPSGILAWAVRVLFAVPIRP
jgi:hypothetical protein